MQEERRAYEEEGLFYKERAGSGVRTRGASGLT